MPLAVAPPRFSSSLRRRAADPAGGQTGEAQTVEIRDYWNSDRMICGDWLAIDKD